MEPIISIDELRQIMQRGLLAGHWSVLQFNKGGRDVVLPSKEFLEKHPQFQDVEFRDMAAYRKLYNHATDRRNAT